MFSPCSVPKEIIGCLIGLQSKLKVCSIHDALCVEMGCVGEIMNEGFEDNSSQMEERGCRHHPSVLSSSTRVPVQEYSDEKQWLEKKYSVHAEIARKNHDTVLWHLTTV